ncbi:MAG TPA: bifunctional (p)ppGpp synthetase/guanosine-3',5'-bis(diphosphate) 3'-pyrophosphohydrolase [Rhodospirillaceae bacterium]|nr:MAG: GTP pyrophosphokinase [Alphaproteobacteria bacterium GWF2_58_20]HAU28903.1 bifunctional (p)ppGpp synthetase/guanosine-3',5'-bis(diphosphate) 3'-pyrophosphohydrolase [Rhodospirillaceae bacterium]
MLRQYELVEFVKSYNPDADEDALNRAYVFAMKAHGTQVRASGETYFSHPLEVAGILTSLHLDVASIITGLLHDTVEDTTVSLDDVRRLFGNDVARLVDGVTKLSKIKLQSKQQSQAENFRKLVLAMSEDIRVLLVKLADRLHNMRTLHHISDSDRRRRIALETLEIYAPLAERVGIHQIKDELVSIAFAELYPDAHASITARLSFLRNAGEDVAGRIVAELKEKLVEAGHKDAEVQGREKTPYSIWRKMQLKNIAFEQLCDIMAFRVVVGSVSECYGVLGLIHSAYAVVPDKFKDYISTPKPNGYRSLHTTVIGPERQRIEIQIRTREMHEVCELGVAAHWAYKQGQKAEGVQYRWLRELLDILEHAQKPEEFLEHTKLELFQDQVFCFTPKGDLYALPRGATPVDFAYAVHSRIGDTCVGAKVNRRLVPLSTRLENGDQLEILTSKNSTPSPTWERFVATGKARARIRRFVRNSQRGEYINLGRAMLQKVFRQEGYDFTEKAAENVLSSFRSDTVDDLYAGIGSGVVSAREVFNTIFPAHKRQDQPPPSLFKHPLDRLRGKKEKKKDKPLPIKGLIPGMAMHFARCCHPLPGDRIVGIVTTGKGVTIHTIDCATLEVFSDMPERWLDVSWDDEAETTGVENRTGRISVSILNEPGSLGGISTIIGKNGGNITNLRIVNRTTEFWDLLLDVEVKDVKHLAGVIAALRAMRCVQSAQRTRGA